MSRVGGINSGDAVNDVNCDAYTRTLEGLYSNAEGANQSLIPVSRFWENALPAYFDAQSWHRSVRQASTATRWKLQLVSSVKSVLSVSLLVTRHPPLVALLGTTSTDVPRVHNAA